VVLQVLADPRQVLHHRDAHLAQVRGGSDAGQHEELRRGHRPRRQDHLPAGERHPLGAVADELDAVGALGARLDQHPGGVRPQRHVQVAPQPDRPEERLGRRAPVPSPHRVLEERKACLLFAVEITDVVAAQTTNLYNP